ncbi:cupin domain [Hydrogenispora ethanolica]|uniref:Cupin domain n=1 Tax=Hydrogenispora ethanolica TaxID=1082276 RepID=A0A4R1QWC6_HYDET|nr:cupin domain-containing protein [Hydrogenispora ethanolica]TCL57723.1 cupin domain [Hydrogenispora ethanolica]
MVQIFNQKNLSFEFERFDMPDFSSHTSPDLAQWVQSKHLQFDVRSLDPDKYSCPYHFHRNAEELFVILSGRATLRTPEGLTELSEGDIVFFGTGPEGAHQLYNHTQEPCRYLDIRTEIGLDVCEYPDSGKINVRPYGEIYRSESKVDYFDGEDKIREKWRELSEKPAQNR